MVTGASKRRREEEEASSVPTVEVPEMDMVPQETHASLLVVVVVTSLAARGGTEEETSAEETWTPECMVKTSMMDGRLD